MGSEGGALTSRCRKMLQTFAKKNEWKITIIKQFWYFLIFKENFVRFENLWNLFGIFAKILPNIWEINIRGVARSFVRGNTLGGQPRGGPGVAPPPDAGEFSKIFKKVFMKIAKNALF